MELGLRTKVEREQTMLMKGQRDLSKSIRTATWVMAFAVVAQVVAAVAAWLRPR